MWVHLCDILADLHHYIHFKLFYKSLNLDMSSSNSDACNSKSDACLFLF